MGQTISYRAQPPPRSQYEILTHCLMHRRLQASRSAGAPNLTIMPVALRRRTEFGQTMLGVNAPGQLCQIALRNELCRIAFRHVPILHSRFGRVQAGGVDAPPLPFLSIGKSTQNFHDARPIRRPPNESFHARHQPEQPDPFFLLRRQLAALAF